MNIETEEEIQGERKEEKKDITFIKHKEGRNLSKERREEDKKMK